MKKTNKIKAEAVKCAKYFRDMMDSSVGTDRYYFKGRFDEVMERNNLTEDDLK